MTVLACLYAKHPDTGHNPGGCDTHGGTWINNDVGCDRAAAGDLEREVRTALEALYRSNATGRGRTDLLLQITVPVVVRLIEAHRAPLIENLAEEQAFHGEMADERDTLLDRLAEAEAAVNRVRALIKSPAAGDPYPFKTAGPLWSVYDAPAALAREAIRAALDGTETT